MNESPVDLLQRTNDSIVDESVSSFSLHFGQLVWAKLASAPFWPSVIFNEENQPWFRQKGKSTQVHVFFFGETAERSWISTTRILPFIGTEKFARQRTQWRRKMKIKTDDEQKLTSKDKTNFNVAMKQTMKLAEFSLKKRVNVLKDEWWYWQEENDLHPIESNSTDLLDENFVSNENEEKTSSSVYFHPLTIEEEEDIIRSMINSNDSSLVVCRRVAENKYFLFIKKNLCFPSTISEHWFYLFIFRHAKRLAEYFPHWIEQMKVQMNISSMHSPQLESLIVLFQHLSDNRDHRSSIEIH